jgi:hypothetical protein
MSNDASNKGAGLRGLGAAGASKTGGGLLSGSLAAIIASQGLNGRQKVEGLYYLNKKIALDGYSFDGCRFDRCTLSIASTNFELFNCIIDESCAIEYGVELTKVIQLFNSRYAKSYEFFAPPFVPLRNQDGTITIKSGL